jgi:hypothetical protein
VKLSYFRATVCDDRYLGRKEEEEEEFTQIFRPVTY